MCTLVLSACSPHVFEEWSNGPEPECVTTSRGRLLLMAQSVPEATQIPCFETLPAGWEFTRAHSRTPESVLVFTTDTFDLDVEVALLPSCDVSASRREDSSRPGTELYIGSDGATFSFVFDGGCIEFDYETSQLAESKEGRDLMDAVPFMTRDTLRDFSGWTL